MMKTILSLKELYPETEMYKTKPSTSLVSVWEILTWLLAHRPPAGPLPREIL